MRSAPPATDPFGCCAGEARQPSFFRRCADLLYPPKCISCHALLETPGAFCPPCCRAFREHLALQCPTCLLPFSQCRCAGPFLRRHGISHLYKAFAYLPHKQNDPSNRLLYTLKSEHNHYADDCAVRAFLALIKQHRIDPNGLSVAYIPASYQRVLTRGSDPMRRIARLLATTCGATLISPLCRKGIRSAPQKSLSREERCENAFQVYDVKKHTALLGKRILLLDDISTTGATLAAATAALRRAGAGRVICMTLAATVEYSQTTS